MSFQLPSPLATFWQRVRLSLGAGPRVDAGQLTNANPTMRWRGIRDLAGSPQPAHLPVLLHLMGDHDPIVRDEAVRTLASWGREFSLAPALDLLAANPSPDLAASVLDLVTLLADPGAQSFAAGYLDSSDPLLRAAAARALGALASTADSAATAMDQSPSAMNPLPSTLIPFVSDPDPRVRRAACLSLGRLGDPGALPALHDALYDSDPSTRQFARQAAARIEAEAAKRQAAIARAASRQKQKRSDAEPVVEEKHPE